MNSTSRSNSGSSSSGGGGASSNRWSSRCSSNVGGIRGKYYIIYIYMYYI
jgi:hypothetical protein